MKHPELERREFLKKACLSAMALDSAFRRSVDGAARERLQGFVYMLLGAAQVDSEDDESDDEEPSETTQ